MSTHLLRSPALLLLSLGITACMPAVRAPAPASASPRIEELVEPNPDIPGRDLFYGVGGRELVPRSDVEYRFLSKDDSGVHTNFELKDPSGRTWDAKFGSEVKSEVVASRLHWAIGFHQPPVYYMREWRIGAGPQAGVQEEARFRYEHPDWKKDGEWAWKDNPFSGTREMRGLLVLNILINNWDLKTSNNKRYVRQHDTPHHIAVVKDLGQSFGGSRGLFLVTGSRSNVRDFVEEGFIRDVQGDQVEFEFRPHLINLGVARGVTVDDVLWTCRRLAQLSDAQWRDAFRAGGYTDEEGDAFIAHLKRKVREGLALERRERP